MRFDALSCYERETAGGLLRTIFRYAKIGRLRGSAALAKSSRFGGLHGAVSACRREETRMLSGSRFSSLLSLSNLRQQLLEVFRLLCLFSQLYQPFPDITGVTHTRTS